MLATALLVAGVLGQLPPRSAPLSVPPEVPVNRGTPTPDEGEVVFHGGVWLSVFSDRRRHDAFEGFHTLWGPADLFATRLRPDASVADPQGFLVCAARPGESFVDPHVASGGNEAVVVWRAVTDLGEELRWAVLGADGTPRGACGAPLGQASDAGFGDLRVAHSGRDYLVTWAERSAVYGRFFAPDGGKTDAFRVQLTSAGLTPQVTPRSEGVPGGVVVTWTEPGASTGLRSRSYVALLEPGVALTGPIGQALGDEGVEGATPVVAPSNAALTAVLALDDGGIDAVQVSPTSGDPASTARPTLGKTKPEPPLATAVNRGVIALAREPVLGLWTLFDFSPLGPANNDVNPVLFPLGLGPLDLANDKVDAVVLVKDGSQLGVVPLAASAPATPAPIPVSNAANPQRRPSVVPTANGNFLFAFDEELVTRPSAGEPDFLVKLGLLDPRGALVSTAVLEGSVPAAGRYVRLVGNPGGGRIVVQFERGGTDVLTRFSSARAGADLFMGLTRKPWSAVGDQVVMQWGPDDLLGFNSDVAVGVGDEVTPPVFQVQGRAGRGAALTRGKFWLPVVDVLGALRFQTFRDTPGALPGAQTQPVVSLTGGYELPLAVGRGDAQVALTWVDAQGLHLALVDAATLDQAAPAVHEVPLPTAGVQVTVRDPVVAPLSDGWLLAFEGVTQTSSDVYGFVAWDDGGVSATALGTALEDERNPQVVASAFGQVAIVWQAFNPAQGFVGVKAQVLGTFVPRDAGVDAGEPDAGSGVEVDAGAGDVDGGLEDVDFRSAACACGGVDGGGVLLAALALLLGCRRRARQG